MALFCATWRAIMRPSNSKIYMPSAPLEEARNTIHAVFPEIGQLFDEYKIGINTKIQ
jgi:hypothetical protein